MYEELLTLADRIGYSDDVVDLLTAKLEEDATIQTLEEIAFGDLVQESPGSTID